MYSLIELDFFWLSSNQKKPGIQFKTLKKKIKHFSKFTNYIFGEYTEVEKAGDSEVAESEQNMS